jgi:hypothetical protein
MFPALSIEKRRPPANKPASPWHASQRRLQHLANGNSPASAGDSQSIEQKKELKGALLATDGLRAQHSLRIRLCEAGHE